VLKLVDRHDSGSCVSDGMGVRVSPRADRAGQNGLFSELTSRNLSRKYVLQEACRVFRERLYREGN